MTRGSSSALSGPGVVTLIGVVAFTAFEAGSLPEMTTLFHPVHAATRIPEGVAPGLPTWVPILLVAVSAILLTAFAVASLLRRRRTSPPAAKGDVATPAADKRPGLKIEKPSRPSSHSESKPFLLPREETRHTAREALRLRRDEKVSATARAAAAERLLAVVPARSTYLFDSTPTLPVHPQVRRRDPRLGLPPALAAALQKQVAAGPLHRADNAPAGTS